MRQLVEGALGFLSFQCISCLARARKAQLFPVTAKTKHQRFSKLLSLMKHSTNLVTITMTCLWENSSISEIGKWKNLFFAFSIWFQFSNQHNSIISPPSYLQKTTIQTNKQSAQQSVLTSNCLFGSRVFFSTKIYMYSCV